MRKIFEAGPLLDVALGVIGPEALPELMPDVIPELSVREMEMIENCKSPEDADMVYGFAVWLQAVGSLKDYKPEEDR